MGREWTLGFVIYIRSNLKIFWSNVSTTHFFRKLSFLKIHLFRQLWTFMVFFSFQVNMIKFLPSIANNEIIFFDESFFSGKYFIQLREKSTFHCFSVFIFQQSCNFFICQYFKKISFFFIQFNFKCFIKIF